MTELTDAQLVALGDLLTKRGEHLAGPLRSDRISGGRSNLTYRLTDGAAAWVLRRPPAGGVIASAHDVGREYRVCSALQGSAVPVAPTSAFEDDPTLRDAPFAVYGYVPGRTIRARSDLRGWSDGDVTACASGLVNALAALHQVDFRDVRLEGLGRTDGYAARVLRRWSGQWEQMGATDPRARRLLDLLGGRIPEQQACAVVHGDFRVDNTILDLADPSLVRAVVDWELSTLGDPVADVALMCAYRHPALNGVLGLEAAWTSERFPDPAALRGIYEERIGATLHDWNFHLALAYYKLAVIAEGIAYRHRLGATAGEGFEDAAATVPEFLEAGLEVGAIRV